MADKKATLLLQLKDKASKQMGKVGSALQGLKKHWLGITVAVGAFVAVGADMVRAFIKQENAVEKLNISLKNQGITSKETSKEIQSYASALQKVTTVGDEVILEQQALLVSFGLTGRELEITTKAALDLSAGLGIDLKAATLLLGKAFTGETSALSRYGIKIEEGLDESEKFTAVMGELNRMFGGAAQARLNTFSGRMENLGNRVGDLKEKIGQQLIPVLETWAKWADKLVTLLEKVTGALDEQSSAVTLQLKMADRQREAVIKAVIRKLEEKEATDSLTASEKERLENARRLIGVIEEKAAAEVQANTRIVESHVATDEELKIIEEAKKQRDLEAKEARELDEELEAETSLAKLFERDTQKLRLEQLFTSGRAKILNKFLTDTEKAELIDHIKRLKEAGKFSKARLIEDKFFHDASVRQAEEERIRQEEIMALRKQAFTNFLTSLSTLQSSKNKMMAQVGKAAAIALATIDTYKAATGAFAALAGIPIVGPALGAAAAAAAITAGLANVAKIQGVPLQAGGIVRPTRGGTIAQIGEAGSAEAIIPLDDDRAREELGGVFGGPNITINAGVIVGGDLQVLTSFDYRFPLTANDQVFGSIFLDVGTVEDTLNIHSGNIRVVPGVELRVNIPQLGPIPIAIGLGFPVQHAPGDDIRNFHFYVGVSH